MGYSSNLDNILTDINIDIRKYYSDTCKKILVSNPKIEKINIEIIAISNVSVTMGAVYLFQDGTSHKDFAVGEYIKPEFILGRDFYVLDSTFQLGDELKELSEKLNNILIDNIQGVSENYYPPENKEREELEDLFSYTTPEYKKYFSIINLDVVKDVVNVASPTRISFTSKNFIA